MGFTSICVRKVLLATKLSGDDDDDDDHYYQYQRSLGDIDGDEEDDSGDVDDDLYFVKGRSSRLPAGLLLLGKGKGPDSDKKERKLVQKVQKVETTTFPADKIRDFV